MVVIFLTLFGVVKILSEDDEYSNAMIEIVTKLVYFVLVWGY